MKTSEPKKPRDFYAKAVTRKSGSGAHETKKHNRKEKHPMKSFKQFHEDTIDEATKVVDDGSVLNVHHDGKHIGNIMKSLSDKKTPFRAYSKHWDMKRLHPTKKAAVDWLVQTHKTAINEEGPVAGNAVSSGNVQGIGFGPKGEPGGTKSIMGKMLKRKLPNVVTKVPT